MELEEFRSQVRRVLEAEVPPALRGKLTDPRAHVWGGRRVTFAYPESRAWLELGVARGWTAPTWPKEYGGGGLSRDEAKVLGDEIARLGLPPPLVGFGLTMIGPTLLQFGSERLRREHLPKIAAGQIRWCQGYSEPNAGSDLAGLQTSAVREGDHFVVNGQKIWTSYGDLADWMFMIVRTDPGAKKQAGITFMLVDMATPGVEVRPIRLISGASPFCETFFADVRVPAADVVGELNTGWTVAKALLGHERAMIANVMGSGGRRDSASSGWDPAEERLGALAKEYVGEAGGKLADAVLRDRIAQLSMDTLCFQLTVRRAADGAAAGQRPGPETSLFKLYGTELNQRRQELMVAIRGMQALGWEAGADANEDASHGATYSLDELQQTRDWLRSRGNTIEGGTSEIQLNVVAKQVLGLPD